MADQLERVRLHPRISINSLAEYLTASPTRRAAIVRDQKRPRSIVVARYAEAEQGILEYLASGAGNLAPIQKALAQVEGKLSRAEKDGRRRMLRDAAAALERFAGAASVFALPGPVEALPTRAPHLVLGGVQVSVRPELVYHLPARGQTGLVKLYFRKHTPLTEEAAGIIAAAVYQWGSTVAGLGPGLAPQRCLVFDVFAGRVFGGPKAFTRRMANLEAACKEIALHWPAS